MYSKERYRSAPKSGRFGMSDASAAAWNIHTALLDWTAKVDAKAGFAIALESGALGVIVALSAPNRTFSGLHGLPVALYVVSIVALLAAAVTALLAVYPRLKASSIAGEQADNYVYFGHLRDWKPDELATRLEEGTDLVEVLARQCVRVSEVAWQKHRLVQLSLALGGLGIIFIVCCALVKIF
jgi:hypothetical protein